MSYLRNSSSKNIQKCRKILSLFNNIQSHPINSYEQSNKKIVSPSKYYVNQTQSKFTSNHKRQKQNRSRSNSKDYRSNNKSNLSEKCKNSFVSMYKKESRLDQIMKLKTKPTYLKNTTKKSLNTSMSSLNSSCSSLNKQNKPNRPNTATRLQKILLIKVHKPQVTSTLHHYRPSHSPKPHIPQPLCTSINPISIHRESKRKQQKTCQLIQKQQRLWKLFEREREQNQKDKRKSKEAMYRQERRKEERFEKLVRKELSKIQINREISTRKQGAFCKYLYDD